MGGGQGVGWVGGREGCVWRVRVWGSRRQLLCFGVIKYTCSPCFTVTMGGGGGGRGGQARGAGNEVYLVPVWFTSIVILILSFLFCRYGAVCSALCINTCT